MDRETPEKIDFEGLASLIKTIHARANSTQERSYTASLLSKGTAKCAEKLGEEAIETVIALVSGDREESIYESADLLYHLLVALKSADISFSEVLKELERRQGVSGHEEKKSRM